MKVSVIIVNWNSGDDLRACLRSIASKKGDVKFVDRIVVVDNGSTDASDKNLDFHGLPLDVVRLGSNHGFGKACNIGAATCNSDYLLFLNPDTRVFEGSITKSVSFLDDPENHEYGVCGIALEDETGLISRTCSRFPSPAMILYEILGLPHLFPERFKTRHMRDWSHDQDADVDHVIGAFYLIRSELFSALGGFDERYFVYLEDLDLSKRVQAAGFRIRFLHSSRAFHEGGGSSKKIKARRLAYSLSSRTQYCWIHFGGAAATWLLIASISIEPISRLGLALKELSMARALETTEGFYLYYKSLIKRIFSDKPYEHY